MIDEKVSRMSGLFPKVRGHVSVDVMENGHVVQHEEHHNYIPAGMLQGMRNAVNMSFMSLTHVGSNTSSGNLTPNSLTSQPAFLHTYPLMTMLMLTDYSGTANENELLTHGKPLARCAYCVESTASSLGSFNTAESYQRQNSLRFVYDFATTQANGTFQSIYTMPGSGSLDDYRNVPSVNSRSADTPPRDVQFDGTTIWIADRAGCYVGTLDDFLTRQQGSGWTRKVYNLQDWDGVYSHMQIHDGRVYWTGDYNDNSIYSAPTSDPTDRKTEHTFTHKPRAFCWHPYLNRWLVWERTTNQITTYDSGWNAGQTYRTGSDATPENNIIPSPNEASIIYKGYAYDLDAANSQCVQSARFITSDIRSASYGGALAHGLFFGGESNTWQVMLGGNYFSRARLDNPVTKTNRQTMKITYDFTVTPMDWSVL